MLWCQLKFLDRSQSYLDFAKQNVAVAASACRCIILVLPSPCMLAALAAPLLSLVALNTLLWPYLKQLKNSWHHNSIFKKRLRQFMNHFNSHVFRWKLHNATVSTKANIQQIISTKLDWSFVQTLLLKSMEPKLHFWELIKFRKQSL